MPLNMNRRRFLETTAGLVLTPHLRSLAQPAPGSTARRVGKAGSFGADSTAEQVTAGIDLTGKTALITGINSGLGYETMRVLALRGAHVLGTARTLDKGRDACNSVRGRATPLVLELADFDSVASCADRARELAASIDIVICNAGVLLPGLERVRRLEKQFVVNHLGHFLLVNRLREEVVAAPQGRVVVVSSSSHWFAPPEGIRFDRLSGERNYDVLRAYGQSKLANGLFSLELSRRLAGLAATSNALHPGVIDTNIFRHMPSRVSGGQTKTVEQGAATACYVATHPDLGGVSGRYFEDCNLAMPSPLMQDAALAAELWDVSIELTEDYLPEGSGA
jgi:WW domain-containing oxidoreductase